MFLYSQPYTAMAYVKCCSPNFCKLSLKTHSWQLGELLIILILECFVSAKYAS